MSGHILGQEVNSDFYWFDCPKCGQRMVYYDTQGQFRWFLKCKNCNTLHLLTMIKCFDPQDFKKR
jgi:ssDNA-binding Zn-finger/Zn-ribbon topoisomerase 1